MSICVALDPLRFTCTSGTHTTLRSSRSLIVLPGERRPTQRIERHREQIAPAFERLLDQTPRNPQIVRGKRRPSLARALRTCGKFVPHSSNSSRKPRSAPVTARVASSTVFRHVVGRKGTLQRSGHFENRAQLFQIRGVRNGWRFVQAGGLFRRRCNSSPLRVKWI